MKSNYNTCYPDTVSYEVKLDTTSFNFIQTDLTYTCDSVVNGNRSTTVVFSDYNSIIAPNADSVAWTVQGYSGAYVITEQNTLNTYDATQTSIPTLTHPTET